MINLIPKNNYADLHAARHNVLLIRFIIALIFTLASTIIVAVATYFLIYNQEVQANAAQKESDSKLHIYQSTKKEATEYKNNLKIAEKILSKNVSYTTMLTNIASALPKNAAVGSLDLSPELVGKPIQLLVRAKSYQDGVKIKDILSSSDIAKDVSLVNISYESVTGVAGEDPAPSSDYPYAVTLSVTFTEKLLEKKQEVKE